MKNQDSIHLLQECDSGAKMAVSSINGVLDKVNNVTLKSILSDSRNQHEALGNEIHAALNSCHSETKEPGMVAKGMSWMKTNMKMTMSPDDSDASAADLITDGCNMGIKSLNEYMNKYKNADEESKHFCQKLVSLEEKLCKELRAYL